jgi:hypothetical protein
MFINKQLDNQGQAGQRSVASAFACTVGRFWQASATAARAGAPFQWQGWGQRR